MKFSLLLFLIFSSLICLSQDLIKGRIVDSQSKQGVGYASIIYKNSVKDIGWYTDSLGYYAITNSNELVSISCVGYQTLEVNTDFLLKKNIVELAPTSYELKEVTVRPKPSIFKVLGYYVDKVYTEPAMSEGYRGKDAPARNYVAQYIANKDREEGWHITKLLLNLTNRPNIKRNGKPLLIPCKETRIRVHLFAVDSTTGLPEKELLNKNEIIINDCNKDNLIIDVSQQNVLLPKNGVFVAIEYVDVQETKAISLHPFFIISGRQVQAGTYNSFHQKEWTKFIDNEKIKFNVQFGIEVNK